MNTIELRTLQLSACSKQELYAIARNPDDYRLLKTGWPCPPRGVFEGRVVIVPTQDCAGFTISDGKTDTFAGINVAANNQWDSSPGDPLADLEAAIQADARRKPQRLPQVLTEEQLKAATVRADRSGKETAE